MIMDECGNAFIFQEYSTLASEVYNININNVNAIGCKKQFMFINTLLTDYSVHDVRFSNVNADLGAYYLYFHTDRCARDVDFSNCDFAGTNPVALLIIEKSSYGTIKLDRNWTFSNCEFNNSVGEGIKAGRLQTTWISGQYYYKRLQVARRPRFVGS